MPKTRHNAMIVIVLQIASYAFPINTSSPFEMG